MFFIRGVKPENRFLSRRYALPIQLLPLRSHRFHLRHDQLLMTHLVHASAMSMKVRKMFGGNYSGPLVKARATCVAQSHA